MLYLKQPTPRTFDYVLVAPKVEEDVDQKAQRQIAFIQQLEKKNISITVSLSTEHCDQTHHSNSGDDFMYLKCSSPSAVFVRGLNMMTNCFLVFVLLLRCLKTTSTCWKSLTPATAVGMWKALSLRPPGNTNMHTSTQNLIHSFDFKDYLDISFTYGAYFDNLKVMKMMKMTTLCCLIANSYCGSPYTCFNSQ